MRPPRFLIALLLIPALAGCTTTMQADNRLGVYQNRQEITRISTTQQQAIQSTALILKSVMKDVEVLKKRVTALELPPEAEMTPNTTEDTTES